jgi:hypothetical protein
MANSFGNPIILDTTTGTVTQDYSIKVHRVLWFNPLSTSDTFTLTSGGQTVLEGKCEAAGQSQTVDFPAGRELVLRANGWSVPTLGSGKLYIYGT